MKEKDTHTDTVWLTPIEVEKIYKIARQTQAKYRMRGSKSRIPFSKVGKFIFYNKALLDLWIEGHAVSSL